MANAVLVVECLISGTNEASPNRKGQFELQMALSVHVNVDKLLTLSLQRFDQTQSRRLPAVSSRYRRWTSKMDPLKDSVVKHEIAMLFGVGILILSSGLNTKYEHIPTSRDGYFGNKRRKHIVP